MTSSFNGSDHQQVWAPHWLSVLDTSNSHEVCNRLVSRLQLQASVDSAAFLFDSLSSSRISAAEQWRRRHSRLLLRAFPAFDHLLLRLFCIHTTEASGKKPSSIPTISLSALPQMEIEVKWNQNHSLSFHSITLFRVSSFIFVIPFLWSKDCIFIPFQWSLCSITELGMFAASGMPFDFSDSTSKTWAFLLLLQVREFFSFNGGKCRICCQLKLL